MLFSWNVLSRRMISYDVRRELSVSIQSHRTETVTSALRSAHRHVTCHKENHWSRSWESMWIRKVYSKLWYLPGECPTDVRFRPESLIPSILLWLRRMEVEEWWLTDAFNSPPDGWLAALELCSARPRLSRINLSALTKIPCLGLHVKYLIPWTDPSCLPTQEKLFCKVK